MADSLAIDDPKNGGVARLCMAQATSQRKDTPSRLGRRDPTAREGAEPRCQARVGGIGHADRVADVSGRECVEIVPSQRTRMSCSLEHKAVFRMASWASIEPMTEANVPAQQQLEQIGAQLDWVREYL